MIEKHAKSFLVVIAVLVSWIAIGILVSYPAYPQDKKPEAKTENPYQPTEVQRLELENLQLKAKEAQRIWADASNKLPEAGAFQTALNALRSKCQKVVADNKWKDVECDDTAINTLTFHAKAAAKSPTPPAPK